MPIPLDGWKCAICGSQHRLVESAAECEAEHPKPDHPIEYRYHRDSRNIGDEIRYPTAVLVRFDNGTAQVYTREG